MFAFVKSFFSSSQQDDDGAASDSSSVQCVKETCPVGNERLSTATSEESTVLTGSFYEISGFDFECVLPQCEVDLDGQMLFVNGCDGRMESKMFNVDRMCNLQQHLPDSFQFIMRHSNDNAEEFGIQFDNDIKAMSFRKLIFSAFLSTAKLVFEAQCAFAEYDTKDREFIILSKISEVRLFERGTDKDLFIAVDIDSSNVWSRVVAANVRLDTQLWMSPQSNQLTMWAVPLTTAGIDKTMFMLELDAATIGKQKVEMFFSLLETALQERNPNRSEEDLAVDEDFDIGPVGDPHVQREWQSSANRRRSYSGELESDEEEPEKYVARQVYSANNDSLVHRFMEVGRDRTFVCRGNQDSPTRLSRSKGTQLEMKVYKKQDCDGEQRLETVGTLDANKFSYKGQKFLPSKGLLHQQEKKLLVVPEGLDNTSVCLMDLETEQVVQKWGANTPIGCMFSSFKHGQASVDPTFMGSNSRNVFLMDTRMDGLAKSTSIGYATNPQLSVGATDEQGHIVMGSRLGSLRLYDGQANPRGDFKRAKTLLECVREPITAVDVTKDGSWVVATTKTFLIVFCTKLAGSGKTGFETALGQKKPAPRYLMISAEDLVKYQITDINFAAAKFDAEEDSIVTSSGNMAVVWDFGTVKRGKPIYSVRFAVDTIKDVQIPADSENVVVAYPTAVGLFGTEKKRICDV